MNEGKTPCLAYFCRQTGKCFCRQTVTTRHILQRQKSPLKGCLQKAFIKATCTAGFPGGTDSSAAPEPAAHSEQLQIPVPVQILFSREEKQVEPTWESPILCILRSRSTSPTQTPSRRLLFPSPLPACRLFTPALPSFLPQIYFLLPTAALLCTQTLLGCDGSFSSFTSGVTLWYRPCRGPSVDPSFLSLVPSPWKAERVWYVVNRKCCASSSHFIACTLPSLC